MQQSLDQVASTEEAYTPHHMKNELKGHFGHDIYFTEIPGKEEFLSSTTNKQRFIHLVGRCLEENGILVQHAQGDADCVIVQVALRSAMEYATVLIRENTDLLILLLFHVK